MPIEIPSLAGIERVFMPRRPISETDRLAREFSYDPQNKPVLVGKLFELGVISDLGDWTQVERLDPSTSKKDIKNYSLEFYSWNPHIEKHDERWVIRAVGNQHAFGIDALKIGIDNAIPFQDRCSRIDYIYMLPYIHFGAPKRGNSGDEEFQKKHSITKVEFILFTEAQLNDLRSLVDSILNGEKASELKSRK